MAALGRAELRQGDGGGIAGIDYQGCGSSLPGCFLDNLVSELIRVAGSLRHAPIIAYMAVQVAGEKSKLDHYLAGRVACETRVSV
jgi:hypothetical protein